MKQRVTRQHVKFEIFKIHDLTSNPSTIQTWTTGSLLYLTPHCDVNAMMKALVTTPIKFNASRMLYHRPETTTLHKPYIWIQLCINEVQFYRCPELCWPLDVGTTTACVVRLPACRWRGPAARWEDPAAEKRKRPENNVICTRKHDTYTDKKIHEDSHHKKSVKQDLFLVFEQREVAQLGLESLSLHVVVNLASDGRVFTLRRHRPPTARTTAAAATTPELEASAVKTSEVSAIKTPATCYVVHKR